MKEVYGLFEKIWWFPARGKKKCRDGVFICPLVFYSVLFTIREVYGVALHEGLWEGLLLFAVVDYFLPYTPIYSSHHGMERQCVYSLHAFSFTLGVFWATNGGLIALYWGFDGRCVRHGWECGGDTHMKKSSVDFVSLLLFHVSMGFSSGRREICIYGLEGFCVFANLVIHPSIHSSICVLVIVGKW